MKKKRIFIGKGGLSSDIVKTTSSVDFKSKGKGIHVEPSTKEKKRQQEMEIKRQRQVSSIMNQRVNDPSSLNKGDLNKTSCYESIEVVVIDKVDEFMNKPNKIYDIENSDFN